MPGQVRTSKVRLGQVKPNWDKSCKVKTGQSSQDRSSQFGSNKFRPGQVKFGQVKPSYDRSSQVGIGLVKQVISEIFLHKFFGPKTILDPKFLGP